MCFFSKRRSFSLISTTLLELGLFQNQVWFREKWFCKMYSCASLALLSDDTVFDSNPDVEICVANQIVVPRTSAKIWKKRKLYPVIVRVLKSLNWMVARKIRFSKIYGLSHSSEAFRIITHVFALAGMDREVYAFLRDIVCYYEKTNLDLFELFPALLDSPNHASRSIVVFDVLVKVFCSKFDA